MFGVVASHSYVESSSGLYWKKSLEMHSVIHRTII